MKILFLCHKSPFPPKEGAPMAIHALIYGLIEAGHDVHVLSFSSNKFPVSNVPESFSQRLKTVTINLNITVFHVLFNIFSKKSLHVVRFEKKEMKQNIVELLKSESFDVVQIETIFMASYISLIREYTNASIVLRTHNIESMIWKRMVKNCTNPIKKWYLKILSKRLNNFETKVLNQVDGVVSISRVDATFFRNAGCQKPMITIPFSVDTLKCAFSSYGDPEPNSFFHIGSMDWIPNQEGIKWFVKDIWNIIYQKNPQARLYLAGRNMPLWIEKLKIPGVVVVGEVEDAQQFMRSKSILVVPLLSGSGIRIKIIEGMACMRPVLTTSIGAEGIDYNAEIDILIADDKTEFIEKAQQLLDNPCRCKEIGEAAYHLIMDYYDTKKIIAELILFYHLCKDKRKSDCS